MKNKKFFAAASAVLVVLWVALTALVWFTPDKKNSESERRPLAQKPAFNLEALLDGSFKGDFDEYLKDQFPLRDDFRLFKGALHAFLLNQKVDTNGLFYMDGHLSQHSVTFNQQQFQMRMDTINKIYNAFIKKNTSNVYVTVIPDKNFYLQQNNTMPTFDYEHIFSQVKEQMSWGQYIDMTGVLSLDNFYSTDTHWKQENILPVAQLLCQAMGGKGPADGDFTVEKIDKPFYGVWYGKAGLPMGADELFILKNEMLDGVKVTVNGLPGKLYDEAQLETSDPYNIYLSGAKNGLVTIENPNATTDKTLVVFRDSFGSSIAPLFVQDYKTITLVDLRVMPISGLATQQMMFRDADVLFMLSALVLNNTAELFM